ncbi:MAG: outer membrane protein assembly factor BamC [Psychrosphaera sp.]|nr:outer membrane protein assembly factor BamC [Psychrosphaera sp.]
MQFWLKSALVIAMTGVVSGCVSPEDRVINEDHQYVHATERGEIRLPEGAIRPTSDDSYKLPDEQPSGDIGEALNIQSPLQLLALASGSRLDDKNKVSKIWFDKTAVIDDLPKFTFDALRSYLKSNKVADSNIDEAAKSVNTGWITEVREGSFWSWSDDSSSSSYKFVTGQQDRANGFITIVNVKLTGHQRNGKDVPLSSLTKNEINRAETTFLNDYIYHYRNFRLLFLVQIVYHPFEIVLIS